MGDSAKEQGPILDIQPFIREPAAGPASRLDVAWNGDHGRRRIALVAQAPHGRILVSIQQDGGEVKTKEVLADKVLSLLRVLVDE